MEMHLFQVVGTWALDWYALHWLLASPFVMGDDGPG